MDVQRFGRVLLSFALLTGPFVSPVSVDARPRTSDSDFVQCFHERNEKVASV